MSTLDNALQALFKMAHWDTLWENASPTSAFAAQTVSINHVSDYDAFLILFYSSTSADHQITEVLLNDSRRAPIRSRFLYNFSIASGMGMAGRNLSVVSEGIEIGVCLRKGMTDTSAPTSDYGATWFIPQIIYGIKL